MIFSPDGSLLLHATSEWLRIYDVTSKTLLNEIPEFISPNGTFSISSDNQRILLLQDTTAKVIDPDGNEILAVPAAGQAALSPDGTKLAVLDYCKSTGQILAQCEVSLYDVDSGEKITSYPGESPQFTPDSQTLILQQQNYLYFRRISDGVLVQQFDPDHYLNELGSWSLSPDGSVFIVIHGNSTQEVVTPNGGVGYESVPQTIDLVRMSDGQLIKQYISTVNSVYLSPNNQYCAIINNEKLTIYDLVADTVFYDGSGPDRDGYELYDISGVTDDGSLVFFTPVSEILGSSLPIPQTPNLEWKDDAFHFNTISLLYDFFAISRDEGQYCQINQTGNAECSATTDAFLASDGNYYRVQVDPEFIDLQKVTGDTTETIAQVDWKNQAFNNVSGGTILGYMPGGNFLLLQIRIGGNVSRVISVDLEKNQITNLWDWDTVSAEIKVMSPSATYQGVKVSGRNYGETTFRSDEGVFDFTKGWFVWRGGTESTYLMRFSQDEEYLLEVQYRYPPDYVGPMVSYVFLYDYVRREQVANYEMVRDFTGEFEACFVNDADISPDNELVFYACADGTIAVAKLLTGETITRWQAFNEPATEVDISEDGTRLSAGAGGFIKMWDVP